jgi:hypothetical protein
VPFVSVTRLRLGAARHLPAFAWHNAASALQLRRAPGFLGGYLSADVRRRTFWTVTAWTDLAAMRAYRNVGAHMRVMPRLLDWCDEASVAHWDQSGAELPDPDEALARMTRDGRISKVRHPSPDHAAGVRAADGRPPAARRVGIRPARA